MAATHFLTGLLTSLVFARLLGLLETESFLQGMGAGLAAWIGFSLTLNVNGFMFQKRPASVFLIDSGFYLVAFPVIGGILTVWR